MRDEDAGFVPVVEGDRLVGVLTDRDIALRCIAQGDADPRSGKVREVMSTDVRSVAEDDDLDAAAEEMAEGQVRRLPVTDDEGRVVGILSHGNIVQSGVDAAAKRATKGVTRGA